MIDRFDTVALAKQLINQPSITPNDHDCQLMLRQLLVAMGFDITDVSSNGVTNTWARLGKKGPVVVFSGHTDVVPPGPERQWLSPPFEATVRDNKLFGRGAADMKAAVAAMMTATARFLKNNPKFDGSIAFMLTSDEEGQATDGTVKLVEYCKAHNIAIDYCIVGEASSKHQLGDSIKVGRRGSLHGKLHLHGKQGHIAYPQLAVNPIHRCFRALDELTQVTWDEGNEHFDPTSFQIYHINADTGATNIIPGSLTASFNFRYCPESTAEDLTRKVQQLLASHELAFDIDWTHSSKPFFSPVGNLADACKTVIREHCGIETCLNTTGGTSDGRFIADLGCELIELGAVSECIHQVNEYIDLADLEKLSLLYEALLDKLIMEKDPSASLIDRSEANA